MNDDRAPKLTGGVAGGRGAEIGPGVRFAGTHELDFSQFANFYLRFPQQAFKGEKTFKGEKASEGGHDTSRQASCSNFPDSATRHRNVSMAAT